MTTPTPPVIASTGPRPRLLLILGIALGLGLLCLGLIVVGLTSFVRLSRDARALRNSVLKSAAVQWDKKIELNLGAFTLNAVRAGLWCVPLDPHARVALRSARGAEAGIYRLRAGQRRPDCAAMLSAGDEAMAARGWERLVGVMNRHELALVYVPRDISSPQDVKVCLVALTGRELVVASVRSDLEPLWELALTHPAWRQNGRLRL